MPKKVVFKVDGKQIPLWSIDPDVETDSYFDVKAGIVHTFSKRDEFLKHLKDIGLNDDIKGAFNKIDALKTKYDPMSEIQKGSMKSQIIADFTSKQRSVINLLKKRGVSIESEKDILKLHKAGEIGSMIVYNSTGCVGDWAYLFPPVIYPNLSWIGWNDRISSWYNLGLWVCVFQHSWYRGARLWVPPFCRYKDIGWWSNRISSIWFYLP